MLKTEYSHPKRHILGRKHD